MKKALIYSLKHSFPILVSFLPVGLAYGLSMYNAGYNALLSVFCSVLILAGSSQFVLIRLLEDNASMLTIAVTIALVNSRHIFYGISFLEKFRSFGKWKYFLIYSLPDETYSLDCSHNFDSDTDEKWVFIFTAVCVASYWFIWVAVGGMLGNFIKFDITGIDFALTALFTIIVIDKFKEAKNKLPFFIAVFSSLLSIAIFGADNFILPALIFSACTLILMRGRIEK